MDWEFLSKTTLFQGSTPQELQEILNCLGAECRRFARGERIYRMGDEVHSLGLVLSGRVQIESDDLWGNHSILDSIGPGRVFAEAYACAPGEPMLVDVSAVADSEVLFLNVERLLNTCAVTCPHHSRLIRNLLILSAQKNLSLSRRMFHTAPKSIRGRLLAYLAFEAQRHGARAFDIPLDRQQLADYLGVDRSAMSAELGRMQREGLIRTRRSHFELLAAQQPTRE